MNAEPGKDHPIIWMRPEPRGIPGSGLRGRGRRHSPPPGAGGERSRNRPSLHRGGAGNHCFLSRPLGVVQKTSLPGSTLVSLSSVATARSDRMSQGRLYSFRGQSTGEHPCPHCRAVRSRRPCLRGHLSLHRHRARRAQVIDRRGWDFNFSYHLTVPVS
jgi:hypothetical protein